MNKGINEYKHIEINIGRSCNNRCIFCIDGIHSKKDKFVSIEIIRNKIIKYSLLGYKSIGFLGGEASIHPGINDIIKISSFYGYIKIYIITNGMVYSDYKKAYSLIKSGVNNVNISIHSHLFYIEDRLTLVKGGLNKKLKAIDNFNKLISIGILKNSLSINFILCRMNYKTIINSILFFYKIKGISDIRINFLRFVEQINEKNGSQLLISYTEILLVLKKIIFISLRYNIRITFDNIPQCIFSKLGYNTKYIIKNFFGESFDHIVDVEKLPEKKSIVYSDERVELDKIKFNNCKRCLYNYNCTGVWKGYVSFYGNNEFLSIK